MTPGADQTGSDLYATLPDEMLGRLLFTGDSRAYEAIYRRHWKSLFSIATWKTNSQIVAEELVQELFMRLWENREKTFIENPEAYLKTALRYSIISFIKAKLIHAQAELGEASNQATDQLADTSVGLAELSDALEDALNLLPAKTRLVFQMSRFEQRSTAEIATLLGLSDRAVEYHITQSLSLLRLRLKDYLSYSIVASFLLS
ncbi:sigma-70 family RNA polymerase sigma factor [Dyadobacter luticola]|uniref:Sigma-70 family RNA polymerase sigma factor n=1 Tax=Dyadobacter luticola TaxID=1979387 RepID=A0A5R9KYS6_9BACT|nr:sigma-70 family RNA polymerase sigma factor [Dyadobacter luticola]TLV01308.1 sigma-70 family RNA polymerase sigma factor [Dyadobacter luticola]